MGKMGCGVQNEIGRVRLASETDDIVLNSIFLLFSLRCNILLRNPLTFII